MEASRRPKIQVGSGVIALAINCTNGQVQSLGFEPKLKSYNDGTDGCFSKRNIVLLWQCSGLSVSSRGNRTGGNPRAPKFPGNQTRCDSQRALACGLRRY